MDGLPELVGRALGDDGDLEGLGRGGRAPGVVTGRRPQAAEGQSARPRSRQQGLDGEGLHGRESITEFAAESKRTKKSQAAAPFRGRPRSGAGGLTRETETYFFFRMGMPVLVVSTTW